MSPPLYRFFATGVLVLAATLARPAQAQLELPAPSPAAKIGQRVGLTDIELAYSSPAVAGRKIWGALVPFGAAWRTGANAATKITFSRDVTFGGKAVPAGSYAVVTWPTAKGWTVILSRNLGLWAAGVAYDAKDDVVRVEAKTAAVPLRERLTFVFSDTTDRSTRLDLEWEKLRVSVPIEVDTAGHVQAAMTKVLDGQWRPHASAARYLIENTKEFERALAYVETSLAIQKTWFNCWIKALALHKLGRIADARIWAQQAWELGEKDSLFFYRDRVQEALKTWK